MPPATRFTVVSQAEAARELHALLHRAGAVERATIVLAPTELNFSVWAQDPFLALEAAEPCLLEPRFFGREEDAKLAGILARELGESGITVRSSSLCFHGGHVLVGDDFALVSRDCLDATVAELGGHVDVRARFHAEFGSTLRIVFVGTDLPVPEETIRPCADDGDRLEVVHQAVGIAQPLDHLDMFVSLAGRDTAGRYRLLVGSPAMAAELLGQPLPDHAMQEVFDDVAVNLAAEGFVVIRNPLPLTYGDGRRTVDGVLRDVRLWYHASANNCLVQIDGEAGDHVWLPTYGHRGWRELAVTDAANRSIWEELGFTVHELGNFHAFAQRLGAVHCIAKDLAR